MKNKITRIPEGWITAREGARMYGVEAPTLRAWIRRRAIPSRRIGPRLLYVPELALAAAVAPWRCPVRGCGEAYTGPEALRSHLKALHGRPARSGAPAGRRAVPPPATALPCPAGGCPFKGVVEALVRHLARHVEELVRLRVVERRGPGRPWPRRSRPASCTACGGVVDTRRGGARGLCATCYRREARRRARRSTP